MDKIIEDFIIKNEFNLTKMRMSPEWNLYSIKDKNIIADKYGIYKNKKMINVSVADIIGYDYNSHGGTRDLLENIDTFFQSNGGGYQTRSNDMLEYNSDNIIEKLSGSFSVEPMVLNEVNGNYFISINGLHRFHVLRLHYLNEATNATNPEDKNKIRNKYLINAKVSQIDNLKTYCNFLLGQLYSGYWLSNEYNANFDITGRAKLEIGNSTLIMTDEELIQFTLQQIKAKDFTKSQLEQFIFIIQENCNTIPSFKTFIETYFSEINNIISSINDTNSQNDHINNFEKERNSK